MGSWQVPEHYNVIIGGCTITDCTKLVEYKGKRLFSLYRSDNNGFLGIDFDLYDALGTKLATIRHSQFVGNKEPKGYKLDGGPDHYVLIEEGTGRLVCELKLRNQAPGQAEIEVTGEMYMPDGELLHLTPTELTFKNMTLSNVTIEKTGGFAISLW